MLGNLRLTLRCSPPSGGGVAGGWRSIEIRVNPALWPLTWLVEGSSQPPGASPVSGSACAAAGRSLNLASDGEGGHWPGAGGEDPIR